MLCEPYLSRFLAKVNRDGPEARPGLGACWLWTGARKDTGYGAFKHHDGTRRAHILAYEHFVRAVPAGDDVCHRCDVRHCVNPEHLFTGTRSENMRDCAEKGRTCRGERMYPHVRGTANGNAKLRESQVRELFALRSTGVPAVEVASRFGVTPAHVSAVMKVRLWAHLGLVAAPQ
jgi:hypothetical protein